MDTKNLADLYSLPALDWAPIQAQLDAGVAQSPEAGGPARHTCWLTTIDPDGGPHTAAVGALWFDGAYWFKTGPRTRKGRNLSRDPRCTISLATHDFDLVVAGNAARITDPAAVEAAAARWAAGGWPAHPDETGRAITAPYSAPSAGPPPWHVYRLIPITATAVATVEPGGATTWQF